MKKNRDGFTLVELLVTMVMFVMVIAAATQVFTSMVSQFKEQGTIQETQIEGLIGLEILRHDIEHAGYGLPWNLDGAQYSEAAAEGKTPWVDRNFNDAPPVGDGNQPVRGGEAPCAGCWFPPGGIRSEDGDGPTLTGNTMNDSDVLVVKSMSVARNGVSQQWTRLGAVTAADPQGEKRNGLSGDIFDNSDRIVVIVPGNTSETRRTLMKSDVDGSIFTAYSNTAPFAPFGEDVFLVYGIMPQDTFEPRMPFNRADFYVRKPAANMPTKCAEHPANNRGTGILYKGQISQNNGEIPAEMPLLDCVADMQVVYRFNTGGADTYANAFYTNTLPAVQVRDQIREVRVYILAQEGQRSGGYRFERTGALDCPDCAPALCDTCVLVGEILPDPCEDPAKNYCGRELNLAANITDWDEYRWKLYTLVVTPKNLRR